MALSDRRVLEHLRLADVRASVGAEELREARLVAVLAGVAARRAGEFGGRAVADAVFALGADDLAASAGMTSGQAERARDRLVTAGVLLRAGQGSFRLSPDVLDRAPDTGEAPDWGQVAERLAGDGAALLVAWAMGDLLRHPARWNVVSNGDLARHTGYSRGTVIRGVQTAVERGVLERGERSGKTSEYRFSPFALGRAPAPTIAVPAITPSISPPAMPEAARQQPVAVAPTPSPAAAPGTVRMEIGGIPIEVPAGTLVRLETDAEGRTRFRIGELWTLGPF